MKGPVDFVARTFWSRKIFAVLVLYILSLGTVWSDEVASPEISENLKVRVLDRVSKVLTRKAYAYETDFDSWPSIVETHEDSLDSARTEEEFARAVRTCLREFGISHLGFQSPSGRKVSKTGKLKKLVGIISTEEDGEYFILRVFKGSPAYEAGIRTGDTIVSIDGVLMGNKPKTLPDATSKRVKWMRGDKVFEKDIEFREFPTGNPISLRWLDEDVAVVTINSFMMRYYKFGEVNRVMGEAKKARAMILDMRGNHGGFVLNCSHFAGHFVKSNESIHMRVGRNKANRISQGNANTERVQLLEKGAKGRSWGLPKKKFEGPVVILVDRYSGSGGELFPAAMRDLEKAVVVGSKTAGALLVSIPARLPGGFYMRYPIYEIAPPSGERIEGNGLTPDVVLSARETATDDIIFAEANEIIENWEL